MALPQLAGFVKVSLCLEQAMSNLTTLRAGGVLEDTEFSIGVMASSACHNLSRLSS